MRQIPAVRGAFIGLVVGVLALAGALAVAGQCLHFRISLPPPPWPWYCADPAYHLVIALAFPVNLLTNDLGKAILLAPLSLLVYAVIGGAAGSAVGRFRSTTPEE